MRVALVTTWPTDVLTSSGSAVFINSLEASLHEQFYDLNLIAYQPPTTDYVQMTFHRFLFNAEVVMEPRLLAADVVISCDYDCFGINPAITPPLVVCALALFGDLLHWESGSVRVMVEWQAFYEQVAMQKAARIVTCSNYAKDRIVELYSIDPQKITVVYPGLSTPTWLKYVETKLRVENSHPVILAVSKMYPRKRLDLLLRAISVVRERHPDVELRLVGDGLLWDDLHSLSYTLGLEKNITWLPRISDDTLFAREWQQADIFAHTSFQETFGFAYLEAMLTGKPIVVTRAGTAPELLGDAALFVEPEDVDGFAAALERFIQDGNLRKEYCKRARQRATLFSYDKMREGYAKVIEELGGH